MNTKQKKIDLMKRWIAALRSGEYKQGKGQLIKDGRYCCLGVLCDVVKDEMGLKIDEPNVYLPNKNSFTSMLPYELSNEFCLEERVNGTSFQSILAGMNDGEDDKPARRFKTIANYIEKNILPLLENEK
jgi:hypothetical protein